MRRDDARALVPDESSAVARIVSALRTLEEARMADARVPSHVVFFLGALDRMLLPSERIYVAMVFGACKQQREDMTTLLMEQTGVERGVAIAGIRNHLESTLTPTHCGTVPPRVLEFLASVRAGVLAKIASLG
jgi:hypothetical protein